jgi:hypothetical protein
VRGTACPEGASSRLSATLVFLTPFGALAFAAIALPLAGLLLAARREEHARALLRLPPPPRVSRLPRVATLVILLGLLALAAMQPALRSSTTQHVRSDAQAFFVLDVSRSMLAARSPSGSNRLARAKRLAAEIRSALPQVPAGIATLTDRVLPDLLPAADQETFSQTLRESVAIEQPPPGTSDVVATSLAGLGALGTQNFFAPSARRRVAVVLTDGESQAFDPAAVAHELGTGPGVQLVLVRVGSPQERVYDGGSLDPAYRPQPGAGASLAALAGAAGGRVYGEGELGDAIRSVRAAIGNGPTTAAARAERTRTLAPYIALLALVPLALLFVPLRRRAQGLNATSSRTPPGRGTPAPTRSVPSAAVGQALSDDRIVAVQSEAPVRVSKA